jgi:hypothetical protein
MLPRNLYFRLSSHYLGNKCIILMPLHRRKELAYPLLSYAYLVVSSTRRQYTLSFKIVRISTPARLALRRLLGEACGPAMRGVGQINFGFREIMSRVLCQPSCPFP